MIDHQKLHSVSVFNCAVIFCQITKIVNNIFIKINFVLEYRVQKCQITVVVFQTEMAFGFD